MGEYNKQPYAYPHLLSVGVSTVRRSGNARHLPSMRLRWRRRCSLCTCYVGAVRRSHRGIVRRADHGVDAAADRLVGDSGGRALGISGLRGRDPVRRAFPSVENHGRACRYGVLGGLCDSVSARVAVGAPDRRLAAVADSSDGAWRARLWWCGLLFVVLAAANIGHLVAVRNEGWGTSEARLSLRYVIPNLRVNGWFYVWDWRFPVVFTLLAIAGLFARRFSPERLAIAGYFVLFFVIDLLFYAGSYNYGADVRYSLLTYPPLAILGGVGASRLSRRVTSTTYAMAGRAVVAGALAFQFLWYSRSSVRRRRKRGPQEPTCVCKVVRSESAAQFVRADAQPRHVSRVGDQCGPDVADRVEPGVPGLSDRPLCGRDLPALEFLVQRSDPVQREFCRLALSRGPATLVSQYRERDYGMRCTVSAARRALHTRSRPKSRRNSISLDLLTGDMQYLFPRSRHAVLL